MISCVRCGKEIVLDGYYAKMMSFFGDIKGIHQQCVEAGDFQDSDVVDAKTKPSRKLATEKEENIYNGQQTKT